MQLLDEALFNLWQGGLCEESDVVMKSNDPDDLKKKIALAKRGLDVEEEDDDKFVEEPRERPVSTSQPQKEITKEAKPTAAPASQEEDESDLDTLRSIARQLKSK